MKRKTPKQVRVFYGYSKLTKKSIKKAELAIYFENDDTNLTKNQDWIEKRMKVVYIRKQTKGEALDSLGSNRMFTKYSYFIDEKPFLGEIDKVLEVNFLADQKNVSEEERKTIREKLRKEYFQFFKRKETPQLFIHFY